MKFYGGPEGYIDLSEVQSAIEAQSLKMTREEYLAFVAELFEAMKTLIRAKNTDYTTGGGPFANFEGASDFGVDPLIGLMIRMSDKFQRLKSFALAGELKSNDSLEDAFKDLIGYSCIALGMLKEKSHV